MTKPQGDFNKRRLLSGEHPANKLTLFVQYDPHTILVNTNMSEPERCLVPGDYLTGVC